MKVLNEVIKFVWLLSVLCLTNGSNVIFAQVNTEEMRASEVAKRWKQTFDASLELESGNKNKSRVEGTWRTDYLKEPLQAFVVVNYAKEKEDQTVVKNEGFAHIRGMYRVVPRLKIELFAQKEFNEFLHLEDRQLLGSGVRWKIIADSVANKPARLYLGIGAMYEKEIIQDSPEENTELIRSTNYLSYKMDLTEQVHFNTVVYYQPVFTNFKDYRLLWQFNMGFEITERLSFEAAYNIRYDNQPPTDVVSTDKRLLSGIRLTF